MDLVEPLVERQFLGDPLELIQQIGRETLAATQGAIAEDEMQSVWDIPDLQHLRHAQSMRACSLHVNRPAVARPARGIDLADHPLAAPISRFRTRPLIRSMPREEFENLFTDVVSYDRDVHRNLHGARAPRDLFDDLSSHPRDWAFAAAAEARAKPPSASPLISRPFDYGLVVAAAHATSDSL